MAEAHFNQIPQTDAERTPINWTGMINGFGAVLSLALVGAIIVWAYQLAVRDVTGIPVIRAMDGPMRVQPR